MIRLLQLHWLRLRVAWLAGSLANGEADLANARAELDRRHEVLRRARTNLSLIEDPRVLLREALRGSRVSQ